MRLVNCIFGICSTRPPQDKDACAVDGEVVRLNLERLPELARPGGAARFEDGLPHRLLVVHGHDGEFHAYLNRCTHAGHRRIDPLPDRPGLRCCSVGMSTYDYDGHRVAGPAAAALTVFPVERDGSSLVIRMV